MSPEGKQLSKLLEKPISGMLTDTVKRKLAAGEPTFNAEITGYLASIAISAKRIADTLDLQLSRIEFNTRDAE